MTGDWRTHGSLQEAAPGRSGDQTLRQGVRRGETSAGDQIRGREMAAAEAALEIALSQSSGTWLAKAGERGLIGVQIWKNLVHIWKQPVHIWKTLSIIGKLFQ